MPTTRFAHMARSDHSMRPPTPATTLKYESPNACNLCHKDQDAQWADRLVREWRSRDYQKPVLYRAGLINAARKGDWTRLSEMLAYVTSPDRDEVFATGLIRLLRACPDARKWPAIVEALRDPSPLVRAAAAEALDGYVTAETLPVLLDATKDEFRLVRVRAAASLAPVPPQRLEGDQRRALEHATAEFLATMTARPDDYSSHYNLGTFHAERGEYEQALTCYETAHKLEPRSIAPLVNASLVYNIVGRNDKAESSLRKALEIEPDSLAAHLNLGMLLGELGRPGDAEQAFRTALKIDPECAAAAYNLGVIVAERDINEAVRLCRTASRVRADRPKYAFAVAFYLHRGGDDEAAIRELRRMLTAYPGYADSYVLLGSLLIERGRTAEAREVYRQAAQNEKLAPEARRRFEAFAQALPPS
jgi:tetratricopeptide (TPR) repeat protein